ncbi:MAG: metallophosphoesterase [Pseudomonadota bacterium]
MVQVVAFWGAFLYFPFLILAAFVYRRGGKWLRLATAAAVAGTSVLAYARFVEPRFLTVHQEEIVLPGAAPDGPAIRVALVADTHYGLFRHATPLKTIVRKVNAQNVDAVFFAGDFSYRLKAHQFEAAAEPLKALDAQMYAVLGNHDLGDPGTDMSDPLRRAFVRNGVEFIENRAVDVQIGGQRVIVGGASQYWRWFPRYRYTVALPEGVPVILLAHNPDNALYVPKDIDFDIMLAGHTHGGQMRVPFLFRDFIPTEWPFDKGLHVAPAPSGDKPVYVTPGTGMVNLPFRFLMPPRIDILTIRLPAG